MYNQDGIPTNGVYQFLKYFLSATDLFKPTHVICCWDMGKVTFRTEIYSDYKQNREEPPAELIPQFELVKKVVSTFEIPNISIENYEADDIIGSLTKKYSEDLITIQTGDQDLLQLVQPKVQVALMKKGIGNYDIVTFDNIYKKRGLYPEQFVEFKAFTGDTADNYPGVKGIGKVTALKLLQTYHSIDRILENKDKLTKGVKQRLKDGLEMFYLSKKLAKIKCDLPIALSLKDAEFNYNKADVQTYLTHLGIRPLQELE